MGFFSKKYRKLDFECQKRVKLTFFPDTKFEIQNLPCWCQLMMVITLHLGIYILTKWCILLFQTIDLMVWSIQHLDMSRWNGTIFGQENLDFCNYWVIPSHMSIRSILTIQYFFPNSAQYSWPSFGVKISRLSKQKWDLEGQICQKPEIQKKLPDFF